MCQSSKLLKAVGTFYILFPFVLFLGLDLSHSRNYYFCLVVCTVFNFAFAALLISRMISRRSIIPATLIDRLEVLIVGVLVLISVFQIIAIGRVDRSRMIALMKAASLLRVLILSTFFAKLDSFFKILLGGLAAFIPQALFVISVLFGFGVFAKFLFADIDVDFDDDFLNRHYNFKSFESSMITLMAMGTGNMWTELIDAVKKDKGVGFGILVDGFFTTFFIFFASLFRSFPLLIIYRYLLAEGSSCDVATQQVNQFQHAWELIMIEKRDALLSLSMLSSTDKVDVEDGDMHRYSSHNLAIKPTASSVSLMDDNMGNKEDKKQILRRTGTRTLADALTQVSSTVKAASDLIHGKITLDDLYALVLKLPAPLGMQGTNISFLDNSKFVRQILLSMPAINRSPGSHEASLFDEDIFPTEMR